MSGKGLKLLHIAGKFPKLKSISLGVCEECIYGKQKAVKISKKKKSPKKHKLELGTF